MTLETPSHAEQHLQRKPSAVQAGRALRIIILGGSGQVGQLLARHFHAAGHEVESGCFLLRTGSELVLKSRRVIRTRLLNAGFHFELRDWPAAAHALVSHRRY